MRKLITILCFISVFFGFSQTADELVQQAIELHKNYPQSSQYSNYLKKAIKINNNHEEALYLLAMRDIEKRYYYGAEENLRKLVRIDSTNPEYQFQNARILIREKQFDTTLLRARYHLEMAEKYGFEDTLRLKKGYLLINKYLNQK